MPGHVPYAGGFRWRDVAVQAYKAPGEGFEGATRQVLFGADAGGASEVRYFELAPGGHTTLERHAHVHQVMVLRGAGAALVAEGVVRIAPFDLLHVPPRTWHQLRADEREALGFLCWVDLARDRPERPSEADLAALRREPAVAAFLRV